MTKTPSDSVTQMTQLVLPEDANFLGNLLGGRLMHLIDIAAAITAQLHSGRMVATRAVDSIAFDHAIPVGMVVMLEAKVVWVGRTSMRIKVAVRKRNTVTGEIAHTNTALLTFVALDEHKQPVEVPRLQPVTHEEMADYEKYAYKK